ncbi:ubiquinone biosynthesis regulatory protein kinase UbiB [Candidatus Rariloculus sp.]|uniref:ubiquinone biosynthesis regulatory protein kinase UbiB n=1 Tax=Candidatus Rariloculus sp. TaxID=3101265 RepID=UPI003D14CCC7
MHRLRLLLRLFAIERTLLGHGLDEIVPHMPLFRPFVAVRKLLFLRRRASRGPLGERIRLALEELGPLFVKFGQAVSVRRDLLPGDIADELVKLQDKVPPFSTDRVVATLESAFGRKLDEVFAEFDETPLAAASIAQVHAARLPGGQEVVVKILRPNVHAMIRRDLEVLFAIAELAERYWPEARRLQPIEVVAEFEKTLEHELDLMREAASAAQLKRNFEASDQLYVPDVHWDYCRANVLTTERIFGVSISDIGELRRRGTNIRRLAENGVEIFFTQVFRHNFFHADMHPGNIFVDVTDPERPRYVAVDFGIVGSLSARDQQYLAENFLAFFQRDYRRVAKLHIDSAWVPEDTRVDELEAAVRAVCEPIFNKPLKDISFGLVLLRLLETARRFDMEIQPQLVLLQKTLLAIEGLGRELYPELDLWRTAMPVLEEWMRERRDPRTQAKLLLEALPQLSEDLRLLPELIHKVIRRTERRLNEQHAPGRARPGGRFRGRGRGPGPQFAGAVLLIAGVLWTGLAATPIWVGWLGAAVGLVLLLAVRRRPRRDSVRRARFK